MLVHLNKNDISILTDHALALWARLCLHAYEQASQGNAQYDLITTDYLNNSEEDIQELADHGYLTFQIDKMYSIKLLKYTDHHPSMEEIRHKRRLKNEQIKRYRRGKI